MSGSKEKPGGRRKRREKESGFLSSTQAKDATKAATGTQGPDRRFWCKLLFQHQNGTAGVDSSPERLPRFSQEMGEYSILESKDRQAVLRAGGRGELGLSMRSAG